VKMEFLVKCFFFSLQEPNIITLEAEK